MADEKARIGLKLTTTEDSLSLSLALYSLGKCLLTVVLSLLVLDLPGFFRKVQASTEYRYASSRSEGGVSVKTTFQNDVPLLEPGKPISRSMQGSETHLFRIAVALGQYLRIVVNQRGIDLAVALLGPGGERLVEVDSPNGTRGNESISAVAESSGEYRIEIRSAKVSPGRYEVQVEDLRNPTESDLARVAAEREFRQAYKLSLQASAQSKRDAVEKLVHTLPAFRALEDRAMELLTLNQVGLIHHFLRDLPKALDYYNRALTLCKSLADRGLEAAVLNNIGGVYDILAEPHKALEYYNQALSISQSFGDAIEQGNYLNNIAVIYANLGERQKALEYYNKALPLIQREGNMRREAVTLDNIGAVYVLLGEPQLALDYHKRALELRRLAKDPRSEARSLLLIGAAHAAMEKKADALNYYNQSLALYRTTGDKQGEATALNQIAHTHSSLGERERSLEYHQQALQLVRALGDRRQEAYILARIGQDYIQVGQPDKALDYCRQALSLAQVVEDRGGQAIALQLLAHAERDTGDLAGARKHIEESISRISAMRADISSQLFRTSYLAKEQGSYEFYIDLLMRMHRLTPSAGHDGAALAISEQSRARTLLEMLNESRVDIREGADSALTERERKLSQLLDAKSGSLVRLLGQQNTQERVAALKKEINQLENEHQQVRGEIRRSSPLYAALTQPQPLSLREIQQQLLDKNTTLLEYSLGEDRSYLWAVTQDSIKSFELPKRALVEKAAREIAGLLTVRSVSVKGESPQQKRRRIEQADTRLSEATTLLSQMVLGPVASDLGHDRLIVIADGGLQYVPFAMLPLTGTKTLGNGQLISGSQPLIVEHEIITLPSASSLAAIRSGLTGRKLAPKSLAVIADPVYSAADERLKAHALKREEQNLEQTSAASTRILEHVAADVESRSDSRVIPRLPFTRQEAERILAIAPAASNLKALDFNANRATAISPELASYRYVHFATHGYLDTENPGSSAIVLSMVNEKGDPQPGLLTANEIYNLKLPAELVVLSACQTGLGKEFRGEGLVGLTRGFMYAGAARVVVSLWSVNDKATSELMQRFYRAILKDGQRPAAALRSAQIEMWKQSQFQAPYYWAAFVLQGEWK
jgi:CHAT domain-containing protein